MTLKKKIYRIPTLRNWHSCSVQTTPSRPSAIKASSMDVGHGDSPKCIAQRSEGSSSRVNKS